MEMLLRDCYLHSKPQQSRNRGVPGVGACNARGNWRKTRLEVTAGVSDI